MYRAPWQSKWKLLSQRFVDLGLCHPGFVPLQGQRLWEFTPSVSTSWICTAQGYSDNSFCALKFWTWTPQSLGLLKNTDWLGFCVFPFFVLSHFNYLTEGPEGRAWNIHEEQAYCTFKGLGKHVCCRTRVTFKQDWSLRIFTAALWADTAITVTLQEAEAKGLGREAAELYWWKKGFSSFFRDKKRSHTVQKS